MGSIQYSDLAIVILVIAALAIAVYLINALRNISKTASSVNALLDANRRNIDETISSLPAITKNIESITGSLKGKTDLLDSLLLKNEVAAESETSSIENLIGSISSVVEIFSEIKGIFGKGKKRFKKR